MTERRNENFEFAMKYLGIPKFKTASYTLPVFIFSLKKTCLLKMIKKHMVLISLFLILFPPTPPDTNVFEQYYSGHQMWLVSTKKKINQCFKNIENKQLDLTRNAAKVIAMIPLLTDTHRPQHWHIQKIEMSNSGWYQSEIKGSCIVLDFLPTAEKNRKIST